MFRTIITLALLAGFTVIAAGCRSDSSVAHRDPIYADLGNSVIDLGTVDLSAQSAESAGLIMAFNGPKTYRFTAGVRARIRASVIAGPGARDIRADLWKGMGWGYVASFEDWQPDWSLIYEQALDTGMYDIVVAPTDNTAGPITVRVEILEILPGGP
ncbi:MAG: hypothetical protein E3J72_09590 [Planctomycetota bacterium]|nr:MAG: hypothetical protein E3J72_09590 [Planctomycetota bacterium]